MRIAIIKRNYLPRPVDPKQYVGGAELNLLKLLSGQEGSRHQFEVFASNISGTSTDPNVRVRRVWMFPWLSFLRHLTFAWSVRRAVRREDCDLVYSIERTLEHDVITTSCHREWLERRRKQLPAIKRLMLRVNPMHLALLWLEKKAFTSKRTRAIIAQSQLDKDSIIKHYSFPEAAISVVHPGVDSNRFRPPDSKEWKPGGRFWLLFVGRGVERKGLASCLRTLTRLPEEVGLQIVGKGNDAPAARLARSLGLMQRIRLRETTPQIECIYQECHLLIHPAVYEPFGNVLLEAMACGLPVVSTSGTGAAELISNNVNGVVVQDPDDIPALAEGVRFFLDPTVHATASREARRAAELYTISRTVQETFEVLEKVWFAKQENGGTMQVCR